jgi:hypothetical protein
VEAPDADALRACFANEARRSIEKDAEVWSDRCMIKEFSEHLYRRIATGCFVIIDLTS